jgi:predicted ATPase/class 3 adenylate cyclase
MEIDSRPYDPGTEAARQAGAAAACLDAVAYVPRALAESVARHPDRACPWHERIEGTLLMGDVSGFTAMSELLAKAGKEGAEWLTDIINSFFGSMLGIASRFGGDTMTFGGDAVLLLFGGEDHARRACAAALEMLDATARLPAYKVGSHRVRLGMSMGAHSGKFFLGSAGLEASRLQCLLFGPGAARTCMAEAAASSGELFVTEDTVAALGGDHSIQEHDGFYLVVEVPRTADIGPSVDLDLPSILPCLLPYLPPAVAAGLEPGADAHEPESDHRKVCVVFINLMGVDELLESAGAEAVLADLQAYTSAVVRLADQHGGYLISNDAYTHGLKLILGFGAPVAHEHDTANALRMAAALRCETEAMGLRLPDRIGVNSGFVFAGDVGPAYRRQYTVMGDAVNLAARLMSAAGAGQTYVSAATLAEAGPGFLAEELAPITVKGKQAAIRVCALLGECEQGHAAGTTGDLVGRDEEFHALERASDEARGGRGKVAIIRGEPGIGKSRLTQALRQTLEAREWAVILGGCQAHTSSQPFAPWTAALQTLLGVAAGDDPDAKADRIRTAVRDLLPDSEPWSPLLAPLLGASLPDTDAVRALKEADRRARLFDLVADLVRARAERAPIALIMEDLHWADASSLALLEHVVARSSDARVLVVATSRLRPSLSVDLPDDAVLLDLDELPASTAVEIVSDILGRRDLPEEMARLLLHKARGNPLFLQEVAYSLAGSGTLEQLLSASGSSLAERMAALEIPDRVQGLLMTRIDALPQRTKDVLRTAAVIGATFERSTLHGVVGDTHDAGSLDAEISTLVAQSLAEPDPSAKAPTFRFRHALIQEVAYDSLMFSKRRQLHRRIAEHLEEANTGDLEPLYERLVHHYSAGRVDEKTQVFAVYSAGKARKLFAHDEAVAYYRRALQAVRARTTEATTLRSLIEERIGDTYETAGRPAEAARAFRGSLERWRRAQRRADGARLVLPAVAELTEGFAEDAREASLCHKIGFAYGRTYSDYDLALQWLDRALETLPRGHPALRARISLAESNAWHRKGDYRTAIEWGRLGLGVARRTGTRDVRAYALTILANSYYELGDLNLAIQRDRRALRLYEELDDLSGQALAQMNLGTSLMLLGRIDESLEHYQVALDMYARVGNTKEVAMVNANIGELYVIYGDFELAIEHLQSVLQECDRMPAVLFLEGGTRLNLARAYQGLRRYDEAAAVLSRAASLLEKAGTPTMLTEVLLARAELELETGRPEAQSTCEQALETARALGHRQFESRANRILGRIAHGSGEEARAEALLRESVSQAERIGAPYERGLGLLALAEVYATWSDPAMRRKLFGRTVRQAIRVLTGVGARVWVERARALAAASS